MGVTCRWKRRSRKLCILTPDPLLWDTLDTTGQLMDLSVC